MNKIVNQNSNILKKLKITNFTAQLGGCLTKGQESVKKKIIFTSFEFPRDIGEHVRDQRTGP